MLDDPQSELQPSLFEALWRHKWLIMISAILAAIVAFSLTTLQPLVYQAEGNVLLTSPTGTASVADPFTAFIDRGRYVRNEAEVFKSRAVAIRASELLGGDPDSDEIQSVVSAHGQFEFDVLTIGATQPTARGAIDMVNAVVDAYEAVVTEQIQKIADDATATLEESKITLEERLNATDTLLAGDPDNEALLSQRSAQVEQLQDLDTQIESIAVSAALYGAGIRIYDEPREAFLIGPKPMRNAAIAAVLALMAAGAWAWWREERRDEVEDRHAPASALNAPLLGTVPVYPTEGDFGPVPSLSDPTSAAAEAYQFVVSSLRLELDRIGGSTVAMTSIGPADGKTFTTLNLAIAASGSNGAPLVIDTDQRTRALTTYTGLSSSPGITDLGNSHVDVADVIHEATLDGEMSMRIVPAGTEVGGDAVRYYRSHAFDRAMDELVGGQPFVLVDAPPILAVAETMDIIRRSHGVVVVVRPGTSLHQLAEARRRIGMTERPIIGYVYNGATPDARYPTYSYGYVEPPTN